MSLDSEHRSRPSDGSASRARSTETTATSPARDGSPSLPRSPRKRATLRYLADATGPVTISALADAVAASEHETTVAALSADQRQRVSVALYQSLLPELDDAGLVEYDKARGTVRPTAALDRVRSALEDASDASERLSTARNGSVTESTGDATAMVTGGTVSLFGVASLGLFATPAAVSSVLIALFAVAVMSRSS